MSRQKQCLRLLHDVNRTSADAFIPVDVEQLAGYKAVQETVNMVDHFSPESIQELIFILCFKRNMSSSIASHVLEFLVTEEPILSAVPESPEYALWVAKYKDFNRARRIYMELRYDCTCRIVLDIDLHTGPKWKVTQRYVFEGYAQKRDRKKVSKMQFDLVCGHVWSARIGNYEPRIPKQLQSLHFIMEHVDATSCGIVGYDTSAMPYLETYFEDALLKYCGWVEYVRAGSTQEKKEEEVSVAKDESVTENVEVTPKNNNAIMVGASEQMPANEESESDPESERDPPPELRPSWTSVAVPSSIEAVQEEKTVTEPTINPHQAKAMPGRIIQGYESNVSNIVQSYSSNQIDAVVSLNQTGKRQDTNHPTQVDPMHDDVPKEKDHIEPEAIVVTRHRRRPSRPFRTGFKSIYTGIKLLFSGCLPCVYTVETHPQPYPLNL